MPLVDIGWTEVQCREWCKNNDLLSPVYTDGYRDGCWFCHNQNIDSLRRLRKRHPDLWEIMLRWDNDSPVKFHADGHTVHDFDKRFEIEDSGLLGNEKWSWSYLKKLPPQQYSLFDMEEQ